MHGIDGSVSFILERNGLTFASFDDLTSYQRDVLGAEEGPIPGAD